MEKSVSLEALALLPHELICCLAKLARWLCASLPPNANPQVKALLCSLAAFLESLCQILMPGTAGG